MSIVIENPLSGVAARLSAKRASLEMASSGFHVPCTCLIRPRHDGENRGVLQCLHRSAEILI